MITKTLGFEDYLCWDSCEKFFFRGSIWIIEKRERVSSVEEMFDLKDLSVFSTDKVSYRKGNQPICLKCKPILAVPESITRRTVLLSGKTLIEPATI